VHRYLQLDLLNHRIQKLQGSYKSPLIYLNIVTNIQVFPQERPAESSTSSQGSDLLAEILEILAAPQYDDLANQVANIYAPSQERPAESSMSSQDSDLFAEISKIKDGDGLHSEIQQAFLEEILGYL
jgi:hypothetical protein